MIYGPRVSKTLRDLVWSQILSWSQNVPLRASSSSSFFHELHFARSISLSKNVPIRSVKNHFSLIYGFKERFDLWSRTAAMSVKKHLSLLTFMNSLPGEERDLTLERTLWISMEGLEGAARETIRFNYGSLKKLSFMAKNVNSS